MSISIVKRAAGALLRSEAFWLSVIMIAVSLNLWPVALVALVVSIEDIVASTRL